MRRCRPGSTCGPSFPGPASPPSARPSPCSSTPSTRSAILPCGRCGRDGRWYEGRAAPSRRYGWGPAVPARRPRGPVAPVPQPGPGSAVLEVRDLSVEYVLDRGTITAVEHVSFDLDPGEFIGIVGESGCGKSTLLFAIAQLLAPPAEITGGSVIFKGRSMVGLTDKELAAVRWKDLSVVMQSAMNALNPVKSIGAQFKDAMRAHGVSSKHEIAARSAEVLKMVGIDPVHLKSYPHQLSGGMRQRSMIAMAMLFTPDLVIMDEPTSALDDGPDQGTTAGTRLRRHLRHPRHVAGQPLLRPPHGHVRGPGSRARHHPPGLRLPAAPLQRRPAGCVPLHQGAKGPPQRDPRQPAGPGQAAGGLPVRAALPQGHGPVRDHAARPVPSR